MDLLNRLAEKVNFTFDVHLSEDGSYGSLRRVSPTQSFTKIWYYDVNSQSYRDSNADDVCPFVRANQEFCFLRGHISKVGAKSSPSPRANFMWQVFCDKDIRSCIRDSKCCVENSFVFVPEITLDSGEKRNNKARLLSLFFLSF